MVKGPRMTSAGRYLSTSNSLTDYYPDHVGVPDGGVGVLTNTVDEMTREVRHQIKNGVDLIKLADSPFGQYQAFTSEEVKRITDLVHQLQKKVTIHARGSAEVSAAVDAGVDWIMHANVMTDDVIEKLAASKILLVPTLLLLANFADYGELVGAPRGQRDGCRRMLDKTADTLHRAHDAGVTFALGTDSGFSVTPYGEWHARELALLMEYAGLSAHEALLAGTVNAAPTVGLAGRVGEVAPGMLADVIVVDGDPLADIGVLVDRRRITNVIQGGQEVDLTEDQPWWPHERAQVFSVADLTYDVVFGEGAPGRSEALPWREAEARDLLSDMDRVQSTARVAG
jgi:imidazolonepropionase-like amidohydrolase